MLRAAREVFGSVFSLSRVGVPYGATHTEPVPTNTISTAKSRVRRLQLFAFFCVSRAHRRRLNKPRDLPPGAATTPSILLARAPKYRLLKIAHTVPACISDKGGCKKCTKQLSGRHGTHVNNLWDSYKKE